MVPPRVYLKVTPEREPKGPLKVPPESLQQGYPKAPLKFSSGCS